MNKEVVEAIFSIILIIVVVSVFGRILFESQEKMICEYIIDCIKNCSAQTNMSCNSCIDKCTNISIEY